MEFYTRNGWCGENYNASLLSGKDLAAIIRKYLKEKYPSYKFSVRSGKATYTPTLSVSIMEAPEDILNSYAWFAGYEKYKKLKSEGWSYHSMPDDCIARDLKDMIKKDCIYISINEYHFIDNSSSQYFYTETGYELIRDIILTINSYRYNDSDGMIDYFDTNFYYDVSIGKWDKGYKVVPKNSKEKLKSSSGMNDTSEITYDIKEDTDTRDKTVIWVVKIKESLSRELYLEQNRKMKELGGYYSKFKHGFIFKENPTKNLINA